MKTAKPSILILTTSTGGGHLNLAQSLRGLLEEYYQVAIANPQSALVGDIYTFAIRHFSPFLTWQYNVTNYKFVAFWLHRVLTPFSRGRFLKVIEQFQPQLIITTHAMLSYATARAIERLPKRVPLVFQLTDLGELNMTWFTEKKADAYLAPTREIFEQAQKQGISSNRLHITGRPLRRQFLEVSQDVRSETLAALGFDPTVFTVFLQGGANGSAGTDRTIEILLSMEIPVQIMLAVGDNQKMAARYAGSQQVRTLPFTERIAPYMAAADVIAGKAGASFITEAFMLEKPFLATTYIPGQEAPNLQFIERHNLGWICLDASTQQELFTSIATNPALIAQKMADIRAYKAWNQRANEEICPLIERLLPFEKLGSSQESV